MMHDNFYCHGFSEEEVRHAQDPKTLEYLLDVLEHDREAWNEGKLSMGQVYYADLRTRFRDPKSPFSLLEPDDENEERDEKLFQALCALHGEKRDDTLFTEYAGEVEIVNDLGLCGLFRGMLMVPVKKSIENARIVVKCVGNRCTP